jgi:phenolic acid decarboxylase
MVPKFITREKHKSWDSKILFRNKYLYLYLNFFSKYYKYPMFVVPKFAKKQTQSSKSKIFIYK